jgi:hypothetical protein
MYNMLEKIMNQGTLLYVIAGICGVGVLSNLLAGFLYRRLIKDSRNMASPKRKFIREVKSQFENNFKMNESVNNISVFVEKWMGKYKFLGINLRKMRRVSSYAMAACFLIGSIIGTYLSYLDGFSFAAGAVYYGAGIASVIILATVRGITDLKYKEEVVVLHMKDFFENSLVNRLNRENQMVKEAKALEEMKEKEENMKKVERVKPVLNKNEGEVERAITLREARQIPIREAKTIQPIPLKMMKTIEPLKSEHSTNIGRAARARRSENIGSRAKRSEGGANPVSMKQSEDIVSPVKKKHLRESVEAVREKRLEDNSVKAEKVKKIVSPLKRIDSPELLEPEKNIETASQLPDYEFQRNHDKLSKEEVDENVARMWESMNQIAAGNEEQREKNRKILKKMNNKEQEEVIREILKEYLS